MYVYIYIHVYIYIYFIYFFINKKFYISNIYEHSDAHAAVLRSSTSEAVCLCTTLFIHVFIHNIYTNNTGL